MLGALCPACDQSSLLENLVPYLYELLADPVATVRVRLEGEALIVTNLAMLLSCRQKHQSRFEM